ncbi:MAG: ABC transporter substrate-binding protein [Jatrophihabitans sp.]|uniref:ABC transporter substrate-binding protein n=1 Tax=Jatrophihabitans sp. TaxID=1932789 RepID=UPI003F80E647
MRKTARIRTSILACTLAITPLVLAACGGSSKGGSGGNNPTSTSTGSGGGGSSSSGGGGGSASGFNAAFDSVVNPSTKTGGTLQLGSISDCDSWDPKIAYYGWCWNMQRLYSRTLINYKTVNGTKFELAPDLATDMGQHNADYTQWTYTLKDGLKWSDGKPITAMDVKYGLERDFASAELPGGPFSYYVSEIKAPADYKGPYKSGDLPDSSIKASGNTITINLKTPDADFDYLMAIGPSAPIPYKTEGGAGFVGATYTKHPMASGPFMIKSYTPGKSLVFVKNPYWSQSTDTIRHPLVNEVDLTIDTNPTDLDERLKAGTLDANAGTGAGGLTPAFQSYVLTHPDAKANTDDPSTAFTQYLPVFQSVITNQHCRAAIFYATNKASILAAYGGPTNGSIATSMTPPGIPGYQDASAYDPYPVGADGTGDLAKAKSELQACGKPNGFDVNFAYGTPSSKAPLVFAAEKAALSRVGIKLTAVTDDQSTYYNTFIGSPSNVVKKQIGMAIAGWGADFPTGVGFYQAIANGNAITDPGTSNYVSLNDNVVNGVLNNGPKGKDTDSDWQNLNHQIMTDAVYLPLYWGKTLMYRNPRMTNVTCNNAQAFGNYDFVNVGVS